MKRRRVHGADLAAEHLMTLLTSWQTWAVLAAVFAALTAIFGKIGVAGVPPDFATLIRTVVILAFLAVVVAATGVSMPLSEIAPRTLLFLALSGLATGLSWLCYYRVLSLGPASQVAPIDKLSIVIVAVLAALFLHETPSAKNWLGIAMVCGGAVLAGMKA